MTPITRAACVLGLTQVLAFGSTYYLTGPLGGRIAADTGWSLGWVMSGSSLGLLGAGLVAPRIGRIIDRRGGRPVLMASSVLFAAGLVALSLAPTLPLWLAAWLLIGTGMGSGLYDAAFSTLGRLYGRDARSGITTVTVFGGFASTVCWPLSAWLGAELGWRGACAVYAVLHLVVALPLYAWLVPALPARPAATPGVAAGEAPAATAPSQAPRDHLTVFLCLAALLTVFAVVPTALLVHLINLLQGRGMSLDQAVALGALFGPAQVGARLVEGGLARHYHPIWTMTTAVALAALGLLLLAAATPLAALALALFGAGNGVYSIARGTLPLSLFGPGQYARLMGRLAMPALLAQAAAPALSALAMERFGGDVLLWALVAAAFASLALVGVLWRVSATLRAGRP
ncbi:MFS transporter [Alsobacter sp. SYSU M60028]|uniref:MFS transporter n=1 Tax=Alsobacter ponti TaxID=2962936 RepID=A0ABT1L9I5_9HYPH|nr:MFS transporter [Alsobacter ponti]MCP8938152.1 MFS transporter [Alsobacter ponti]